MVRKGKIVAQPGPVPPAHGRVVKDLLRTHRPDRSWAGELARVRSLLQSKEPRRKG